MKAVADRYLSIALLGVVCAFVQPGRASAGQSAARNSANDDSQNITITRSNAIPSAKGPADHFTGDVKMDTLAEPQSPGRIRLLSVTFTPGSYTNWHSHPLGQLLVVTQGDGFIQQWGGKVQAIHPGDVIYTPPNVKHWHGAGMKESMTHISVYVEPNGEVTKWMERVTPEEYSAAR